MSKSPRARSAATKAKAKPRGKSLAAKAKAEAARLGEKHGHLVGSVGSEVFTFDSIPTGSLSLDYALGTAGWPAGHPVEVFGPRDVGKSSIIGLSAIKSAQRLGKLCGIVALEPGFDEEWAVKNGVDPEGLVIARPNTGEQAFKILHEWVNGDIIDFILFDSIGAVLKEAETSSANEKAKPNLGGASGLITWGMKNILMPVWKNKKYVIMLNQVRDDMNARFAGSLKTPGGRNIEHTCAQIVQLKVSGSPIVEQLPGEDRPIHVGRDLVAVIKRNKLSEGTDKRAEFTYYQMDTPTHTVGIDAGQDITRTAIRTRVLEKKGNWYHNESFPEGKILGKDNVAEFLNQNEEVSDQLREQVLKVMVDATIQTPEENSEDSEDE